MDYGRFVDNTISHTLSPTYEHQMKSLTNPTTPGFKNSLANKKVCLISELEQSGPLDKDRMCPSVDSVHRATNETPFLLSKKIN